MNVRDRLALAVATTLNQLYISDKKPLYNRHGGKFAIPPGTQLWTFEGIRPSLVWRLWFLSMFTNYLEIYRYPTEWGWMDMYIMKPEGLALRERFFPRGAHLDTIVTTLMPPLTDAEVKPLPLIQVTMPQKSGRQAAA